MSIEQVGDSPFNPDAGDQSTGAQDNADTPGNEPGSQQGNTQQNKDQQGTGSGQQGTDTGQPAAGTGTGTGQQPGTEQPAAGTGTGEASPEPDRSHMVEATYTEAGAEAAKKVGDTIAAGIQRPKKRKYGTATIGKAVVIIIIIAAVAYLLLGYKAPGQQSTSTYTTVPQSTQLSSCGNITSPGTYTIHSNIRTRISSGPCIDIRSSNVRLVGSSVELSGNGPFVNRPPFTYGILVQNASNVSIQGFNISRFSYAVYFSRSAHSIINSSMTGNSTMSNIYLNDSPYTEISNDIVFGASDPLGAVFIDNMSNSTSVVNTIIEYNAYYGTAVYSMNDVFYGDNMLGNQVDLYCNAGSATYRSSSTYSDSKCSANRQCNFATCSKSNYDFDPSSFNLSTNVVTCGNINAPGTYNLGADLNLGAYANLSRTAFACITVSSVNVNLNCNGHSIINSHYGVYGKGVINISVENCNFVNSTYGTYFGNSAVLKFSHDNYSKGVYGLYLQNDSFTNITTASYVDNTYGTYLNNTVLGIYGVNATRNKYGAYFNGSSTAVLYNGSFLGNSAGDLYCSANAYNRTGSVASKIACGTSDCEWAQPYCAKRVLPPLVAVPINSCTAITVSGNYSLNTNLLPSSTCIRFDASNINLNCNSHLLSLIGSSGTGFLADGVSNITLSNCRVQGFTEGFSASNSFGINISNSAFSSGGTAVQLYNVSKSHFVNISASNYSNYGFSAQRLRNSSITYSMASSLATNATGFVFMDSTMNNFANNTASSNRNTGFSFSGSKDNNVYNNTGSSNGNDFACSPDTSGIYAELNGVNYGLSKTGCTWLVELPKTTQQQVCFAINTVNKLVISHDMLYPYGTTCFSVFNSNKSTQTVGSIINCQGHTIYASNGGTFAEIFNTSNIEIENCILKNFTDAITSSASYTNIINSTIATSSNAIVFTGSNNSKVTGVNIFNASRYGIRIVGSSYDAVSSVNISSSGTGISTGNGPGISISGANVTGTRDAINFSSTFSSIGSSRAYGSAAGLECSASAQGSSSSNKDLGNNACSITNCAWITSSLCKT